MHTWARHLNTSAQRDDHIMGSVGGAFAAQAWHGPPCLQSWLRWVEGPIVRKHWKFVVEMFGGAMFSVVVYGGVCTSGAGPGTLFASAGRGCKLGPRPCK